jgi:hypothetical protein
VKSYLQQAFGPDLPIFVSSDKTSIGGGKKWFTHVIENLRGKKVVLCLVSQESKSREWVNFEAGYGEGHGACIIPVAIKNLPLGAIGYPLSGYQARAVEDIQAIIDDIAREARLIPRPIDQQLYLSDLLRAEDEVQYKSVNMRPYTRLNRTDGVMSLHFEIENSGNTDVELLFAEATVGKNLFAPNWNPYEYTNQLVVSKQFDESIASEWVTVRYWTHAGNTIERLVPVLTRSMGPYQLPYMTFRMKRLVAAADSKDAFIRYQLHVRGYDTTMETVHLDTIERRDC